MNKMKYNLDYKILPPNIEISVSQSTFAFIQIGVKNDFGILLPNFKSLSLNFDLHGTIPILYKNINIGGVVDLKIFNNIIYIDFQFHDINKIVYYMKLQETLIGELCFDSSDYQCLKCKSIYHNAENPCECLNKDNGICIINMIPLYVNLIHIKEANYNHCIDLLKGIRFGHRIKSITFNNDL